MVKSSMEISQVFVAFLEYVNFHYKFSLKKNFITHLNFSLQNYSMDCYFRQYWRDTRLSFTGLKSNTHSEKIDQLSLNVKMLEKIWKPDTYFHNGLSSYLHTITRPNKLLRISEHGDITYSMRYTIF